MRSLSVTLVLLTLATLGGAATVLAAPKAKPRRPTAYVFLGTTCPATARYVDRLKALEQRYRGKVDFLFVYPNRTDSPQAKAAFHKEKGFAGPMIDDQGGKLAKELGAQRTSEVVLVDRKGKVVYRGAIDDHRDSAQVKKTYLATAIDELLAGKPVTTSTSPVFA